MGRWDYYPFGAQQPGRSFNSGDYRFGFNGMEKDDEIKGSGNSLDFGARIYDSRVGRFLSLDSEARLYPSLSDYHFVRNNPILRIDPTGKWDITVHAYSNRNKYGYGIAIVTDRMGNEVYRFKVRLQGIGGSNRSSTGADTPTGSYDIPNNDSWKPTGTGERKSYGQNPRLLMSAESGEIIGTGRKYIRIHGGQQETFNRETGEWEPVDNPELKKTKGCLRCYDSDINTLKGITDKLEADDNNEFGGKITITDDLEERDGLYYTPEDARSLDKSVESDERLSLYGSESRQTTKERAKGTK